MRVEASATSGRAAPSTGPGAPPRAAFGHRPYLDGLRAVAVYLVVLFHAGSDRFSGGFIGVDVFFVLSGFLVTHLLLRDLVAAGSIGLRRFYARRFRRLLPAAALVLLVSALVASAMVSPVELAEAEDGFGAAFLYWTNWYFIGQSTEYFGADPATSPVLHFWSLAVEEQFYLIWPLLLGSLFVVSSRFGVRRWHVLWGLVSVGAVASLLWAWSLKDSDPLRAYYGTDTRAYQLLAGALLALSPSLLERARRFTRSARLFAAAALVLLVAGASSWVELDAIERGLVATVLTMALIVALETAEGGSARRVLSLTPVVYLGRISYGTYLWHWPVLWVMALTVDLSVVTTIALTILMATSLASLSFQMMEHPVRVSALLDRHRTAVIVTGLAVSVVSALVFIPRIVDRAIPRATAALGAPELAATGFTPVPPDLDLQAVTSERETGGACDGGPVAACIRVEGTGPHVLLMGDSHAAMMIPAFREVAERRNLTLSVATSPGCPWQRNLGVSTGSRLSEDCERDHEDRYARIIPELDPDIVVVMNGGYEISRETLNGLNYLGPDGRVLDVTSPEFDAWLGETTRNALDELGAGRDVVVLEPVPLDADRFDPAECLSDAAVVEECRFVGDPGPTPLERMYRSLAAEEDRVWSVDLDQIACPYLPICDPIIDGRLVRADASHFTREFAAALSPAIGYYLVANGILE